MPTAFLSASWYRVAALHPRLRDHVDVHIHRYRGKVWYILQDSLSGQTHRLAASAYMFVAMLDGRRTLDRIWLDLADRLGNEAPSQDEVISLLGRLFSAEMLQTEVPPDARELLRRHEEKERRWLTQFLLNPVSIKLPLWDPDAYLQRTLPYVRWIFTRIGLIVWLAVVARACVLAAQHWDDLTRNSLDQILAAENLLLLSATFILIKAIHEFGHAYAIKAFGGEAHELGVMLLVLLPTPYVDASYSTGFTNKWHRMLVGSAGILIELFIAAIALEVWLLVDAGAVRSLMFNVLIVASVTTVVFNGNPLLRYDGYYVLADLIEIPNLAQRANSYWAYLADRYLFSVATAESPATDRRERVWFALYAPVSYLYRLTVMLGIALMLASQYLIVGVVIALWTLFGSVVRPVLNICRQLLQSGRYQRDRRRVVTTAAGVTAAVLLFVTIVPMPLHTTSEGVIWLPETAILRARTDGFVERQHLAAGTMIGKGDVVVSSTDPVLAAKVRELEAKRDELGVQLTIARESDRVDENLTAIKLAQTSAELDRERQQLAGLTVASEADGELIVAKPQDLLGGFNKRGEILAFVAPASSPLVRVTVDQDDIGLVRNCLREVRVMLASDTRKTYDAEILREVPGAMAELPSKALAVEGGGRLATDPRDPDGTKTMDRLFQLEMRLPSHAPTIALGSRVYVRFEHCWEPLGFQAWRRLRQLLMSRLND